MYKFYESYLLPIGLLAGTIIGAGIFALPYVFKVAGIGTGLFYLALGAVVYSAIHLMYADVILRTPGRHRFVGYTREYLGNNFFFPAILISVVEMIFVLTVYLVLSYSFANLITPLGAVVEKIILFWLFGSLGIFLSVRKLAELEFWITGMILAIIGLILFWGFKNIMIFSAVDFYPVLKNAFIPLAPVLFAISGRVAIPSLVDYFNAKKLPTLKKAVVWGTVVPALVYALFVFGVLMISPAPSEDAVSGLMNILPQWALSVIGVLGLFSLYSSYIVVGLDVRNILRYDIKLPSILSVLVVIGAPIFLYFIGFHDFIALVSFTGGIFLSLEGMFIIAIWLRANKVLEAPPILFKKRFFVPAAALFLVFLVAMGYEVIKYLYV